MAALASLTPTQHQLLDYIAGPESAGRYNVINGGQVFHDYKDHPRVKVPLRGGNYSTAAGRYQMLGSTWDYAKRSLGLADFSPENQDRAALWLADQLYSRHTKRSLESDFASGSVDWKALAPVWTSVVHDPAKPKPGESPAPQPVTRPLDKFPGLVNTPEMNAALQALAPQHQFTPIDYDPWKLAPHLEPIHHDPFNPPGGTGDSNAQSE